ncbi:MAG: PQQ-binding-like beta-propeller repeat protein, partial [Candidatus Micrarchaeota archaeon]
VCGAVSGASPKWVYTAGSNYLFLSSTNAEKTLFFATGTGALVALNKTSGRIEWQTQVGPSMFTSPVYSAGRVYTAAYDGTVSCIDAKTRIAVWTYKAGGSIWGSTPRLYGGILFVGSENGKLYAINASNGKLIWEATTGGPIRSTPLAYVGNVYVGSGDSKFYAFDIEAGKKIWEFKVDGAIWTSSPTGYLNTVYVGSVDGNLYAVSADKGRSMGAFKTDGWIAASPIAPDTGFVYFGSNDGNLYSLDAQMLDMRWKFGTGAPIQGIPKVADSPQGLIIYIASNDGHVYALRARNGMKIWDFSSGDWVGSPFIEGDFVYFTTQQGKVYAVSTLSCDINYPSGNFSTNEDYIIVNGTATSTGIIRKVNVRLNGGEWKAAEGTTDWSANISLRSLRYGAFEVECAATNMSGIEEVAPYTKATFTKTEFVPLKVMQVNYPKEANAGQIIKIEVLGEDGAPLKGALIKVGNSEYSTGESGVAEKLAIRETGKIEITITRDGYENKTIEIEIKQEVNLYLYLYAAVAAVAIIALVIGLKRRKT